MSDVSTEERSRASDGVFTTWRESSPTVKAVLLGIFVNRLGGFLQVFLVLFLTHRGFSDVRAGTALGAYGAGSVAGVLFGGAISDRIGPRWTIVSGMLASAALLVAILYLHPYPALLAVVTTVGAVSQFYRPASAALLAALTPRARQVMVFAMSRLALNLGTTAAPLLGAALVAASYDLLFWGEAVTSLTYAGITCLLVPAGSARGDRRGAADAVEAVPGGTPEDAGTAASSAAGDAGEASEPAVRGGYLALFADRRYLLYLLAMTANAAVYMQYVSTLPLAVRAAGLRDLWYSVMVALNGLVVILFELPMTTVVSRWPARRVIGVGFPLLGAGLAMYSVPGGVVVFLAGTLMWSLAEIIQGPTMFAYPAQAGPERLQGRYIAAAHGMFGVGAALGPVAGVALWSGVGRPMWILCGLVSVLALIPGQWGIRPERARENAT